MKEIEVGEYVRDKWGKIHKVCGIKDNTIYCDKPNIENPPFEFYACRFYSDITEIIKHSHNIIDLIEVGDILEIKEGNDICYLGLEKDTITVNYNDIKESIKNGECQLLAILTKEQFTENCYKVEE